MGIPRSLIPPFASTIRDEEPLDIESIGSEKILLEDANVQSETSSSGVPRGDAPSDDAVAIRGINIDYRVRDPVHKDKGSRFRMA